MPCASNSLEEMRVCGDRPEHEPHSRAEGSKPRVEIKRQKRGMRTGTQPDLSLKICKP